MKIKRYFPNFFSGFEDEKTIHEVDSIDELVKIDWIQRLVNGKYFNCFSISDKTNFPCLMVELVGIEYNWYVIAHILDRNFLDLPNINYKTPNDKMICSLES